MLVFVRQGHLKDNPVTQMQTMKYAYIYYISQWCNFVKFSIRLTFKTYFFGESDVVDFKCDSEYYCDPILQ